MDRTTFIDKIKLLFSEVEEGSEKVEHADCDCKGEKDCDCDKYIEEEMADEEAEVEAPEKEECKCEDGDEDCKCDEEKPEEVTEPEMAEEVVEEEVKEEEPKEEDEMEKRLEALEKALANISESMSAIDNLSEVVSKLANSPAEEEVKLSKASGKVKKELTSRESKLKAFAKR